MDFANMTFLVCMTGIANKLQNHTVTLVHVLEGLTKKLTIFLQTFVTVDLNMLRISVSWKGIWPSSMRTEAVIQIPQTQIVPGKKDTLKLYPLIESSCRKFI